MSDHEVQVTEDVRGGWWATMDVAGGWRVSARVVARHGLLVVSDVCLGPVDQTPDAGVTAQLVRAGMRLRPLVQAVRRNLRGIGPLSADVVGLHSLKGSPQSRPQRRLERAVVALGYAAAVRAGSPSPARDVAEQLDLTRQQVRERLRAARREGFLASTRKGKAGGDATDAAFDEVERALGAELRRVGREEHRGEWILRR
jgi:hypothetical protein